MHIDINHTDLEFKKQRVTLVQCKLIQCRYKAQYLLFAQVRVGHQRHLTGALGFRTDAHPTFGHILLCTDN